jgi:hypothetical protein
MGWVRMVANWNGHIPVEKRGQEIDIISHDPVSISLHFIHPDHPDHLDSSRDASTRYMLPTILTNRQEIIYPSSCIHIYSWRAEFLGF